MNPTELVESLIRKDPQNITTKQDALFHALFVPGNGLGWNTEGNIVDHTSQRHWEEHQEYASLENMPDKIVEAIRPIIEQRVMDKQRVVNNIVAELEKPIVSLDEVYVDPDSLSASMPENVTAQWRNVFDELTKEANVILPE